MSQHTESAARASWAARAFAAAASWRARARDWYVAHRGWGGWQWVIAALFVLLAFGDLVTLLPNFDEGVYILQAKRMLRGETPYVSFFYHQTPLYLYLLALVSALDPGSLMLCRLLSLVAAALTGVVIAHFARRLLPGNRALLAQLAFYCAPLQRFGMLALPNATMLLASTAGITALTHPSGRKRYTVLGGVCLALAVLLKPLDLPVVLAAVAGIALWPEQRKKLPLLAASGAGTGLCAWAGFHLLSHGGFTQVLLLQAGRYAGRSGFEIMSHFADFHDAMVDRGATTAVRWNVSEHLESFTAFGIFNGNLWLLIAGLTGLYLVRAELERGLLVLLALWLGLPFVFSIWIWEPSWDHYFVQYLPVLSLGASLLVARMLDRSQRSRRVTTTMVALFTLLGLASRPRDPGWYLNAQQVAQAAGKQQYFTFAPLIHVLNRTEPACGFMDPMNVYGEYCAASIAKHGPLARFVVSRDALLKCLGTDTKVVIDQFAFWFMDETVAARLAATPERLIFFSKPDQARFEQLTSHTAAPALRGGAASDGGTAVAAHAAKAR